MERYDRKTFSGPIPHPLSHKSEKESGGLYGKSGKKEKKNESLPFSGGRRWIGPHHAERIRMSGVLCRARPRLPPAKLSESDESDVFHRIPFRKGFYDSGKDSFPGLEFGVFSLPAISDRNSLDRDLSESGNSNPGRIVHIVLLEKRLH